MKKRSKNLDSDSVKQIVALLDGWSGRLTWDLLIDSIELRLFSRYTRQALHSHKRIRETFRLRKDESISPPERSSKRNMSLQITDARIARLEAENRRLDKENRGLLEQRSIWAYNAYIHGLNEESLSRPLPRVDRGQTR